MATYSGEARVPIAVKLRELFPHGCRRVLFIEPPNVPKEDFLTQSALDKQYPVYPPEGLAILAADLRTRGYETELLDLNFMLQCEAEERRDAFEYDIWQKWLGERITAFRPDCIVLTCMFTIYHRNMKRIAEFSKEHWPGLPVIAGGVHTSSAVIRDKETRRITRSLVLEDCPHIDIIGLYEGNESFGDMLDVVNARLSENKLTQLMMDIDGELAVLEERAPKTRRGMDLIPDYRELPVGDYSNHGRIGVFNWLWPPGTRAATVLTNIGCRAKCGFCSVSTFNGKGVFSRSIDSVADELQMLKEWYGITWVMLLDDDPTHTEERFIALCNEIVRRRLNMFWDTSNGLIASTMTPEIAAAAYEAGCRGMSIGIESGNPEILKSIPKPSGVRHFYQCAEILQKYPEISTKGLLMCGFPGETIGQIRDTVKLAVECEYDRYTTQPLNLIPGVHMTQKALDDGIIDEKSLIDGTERPHVGSTGGEVKRMREEKAKAQPFVNLLLESDPRYVPTREEIKDMHCVKDYLENFPRLFYVDDPVKLEMYEKLFLWQTRSYRGHAIWTLFFAVILYKLGRTEEAKEKVVLARRFVEQSEYWQKRFAALGLYEILEGLEADLAYADYFRRRYSLWDVTIGPLFERAV